VNGSTAFTQNGLNQQISIGGVNASWDSKGNLTSEPQSGKTYRYSSENLLTSASGGVTLAYDPAMRLYQTVGAATTRFLYDALDAIGEYNGSNALQRRFVFDPTTGQPVIWYEGTGVASTDRRYLSQDERGSVISVSSSTGASLGINTYDEYGKPGASNIGRYQYTGQKWIGELNLYDYHFQDYVAHLGIFAQTDPIGQADDLNLCAYVGDDLLDNVDPLGLACTTVPGTISICGHRFPPPPQNPPTPGAGAGTIVEPGAGTLGGAGAGAIGGMTSGAVKDVGSSVLLGTISGAAIGLHGQCALWCSAASLQQLTRRSFYTLPISTKKTSGSFLFL